MVRGRIGGSGAKFNVGEAAVTRCVVRTGNGYVGVGYVLGRDRRQAELAALFDALLQDAARRAAIEASVLEPLVQSQRRCRETQSRKSAATKVEFYTLARADDD
jgi:alpha-D-ribose 1-methylphosphonate 5-triphosphate synthase subunit PhnG